MLRTFDSWNNTSLFSNNNNSNNSKIKSKVWFILAWFHAVLQERRSFIPQGWSKFYEFSNADLRSSVEIIDASISNRPLPDWSTIHGLLENAIYGGRIDNEFDLKVLRSYLLKYFNNSMVNSNVSELYKSFSIPNSVSYMEFVKKIHTMSDIDIPTLFGLPGNASKLVQISRSSKIIDCLKSLAITPAISDLLNKERWSETLTPIISFWKKIIDQNKNILFNDMIGMPNNEKINQRDKGESLDPIRAFLSLEFKNAIALFKFVDNRLKNIEDAIRGTVLVNSTIKEDSWALLSGNIPPKWQEKWDHGPNTRIQVWLNEVIRKTLSLYQWCEYSKTNSLLKQEIDLRNLFNPNIFLNAFKQYTARNTEQALDELNHLVAIFKNEKKDMAFNCTIKIKSLLLQGAAFIDTTLSELISDDSPTLTDFPVCEIAWITTRQYKEIESKSSAFSMELPIYFSLSKEKLLTKLLVPCGYSRDDEQKFILSGAALFIESFM
jgi:dynein heavy chain 2